MPEASFHALTEADRRRALEVAAGQTQTPAHLLEKDVWIVETLRALLDADFGQDLTFKGGTSLSKAYRVIRRFSEDLDITYDIRAFAPDLAISGDADGLPPSRKQGRKWKGEIETRLHAWVGGDALRAIEEGLARAGASARARAENDTVYVSYQPLFEHPTASEALVDFGARSTGEPRDKRAIVCDAALALPDVAFPTASPYVMLPERTFWEKATAAHVFCVQQRARGERLSRHWHDLARLDDAGYAESALADRGLALRVARHKAMFFRESGVDYEAAASGGLRLVPGGQSRDALADDYNQMLRVGMLYEDSESFDGLMARCADIEARASAASAPAG